MLYIQGGCLENQTFKHRGCLNKTPPLKHKTIFLNHELVFAEKSSLWNGGVCFLSPHKTDRHLTRAKMYLITWEQFVEVVEQENHREAQYVDLKKQMNALLKQFQGTQVQSVKLLDGMYGRLVYLGLHESYPMFTFTTPKNFDELTITRPGNAYLQVIYRGLSSSWKDFSEKEAIEYFLGKRGVKEHVTVEELKKILQ